MQAIETSWEALALSLPGMRAARRVCTQKSTLEVKRINKGQIAVHLNDAEYQREEK